MSLYDFLPQNAPKHVWTPLTYITLRGLHGRTVKNSIPDHYQRTIRSRSSWHVGMSSMSPITMPALHTLSCVPASSAPCV
jgi:hypothetical protein